MPAQDRAERVSIDGKFFRLGSQKFYVKGLTYGPFAPNEHGETFARPEQTRADMEQIRGAGANLLRVYYVPPRWFLELAAEYDLKVLVDIPWPHHLCFLDSPVSRQAARHSVSQAVASCKGLPAVFAYSVANEIPAEIIRWSGIARTARFVDELIEEAKSIDPTALCTFSSFPPTEFLHPQNIDFVSFNVYLHQRPAFEGYLARLQSLAAHKPLVLGEFGMDSLREGEANKCEFLAWQIESAFRSGLAGTVLFSYTDDWFRGGHQIEDWGFGLTTRQRQPKESLAVVQKQYQQAPCFPLPRTPKVSVVVASYNGARTLKTCLDSLGGLNYPDYEVILVDDGSTDDTGQIAQLYQEVRYLRQNNLGLSAARNAGIAAATGEIVAFTDSDCRADEDWLYYLVNDLLESEFVGIGGHNFLPPEDSLVAAVVMVSPGGPAHVMLTDREAEHIPGCNMAFYRWALQEIGGFDPVFRKAGDDVDLCWRLQKSGHKLGFSPAGFVWHYRRSSVKAYLKQQAGYGEAEALLVSKHPEYFNLLGGGIWRGRIYTAAKLGVLTQRPVVYHGIFGSGFFQKLYAAQPAVALMLFTSLPYHAFVTFPLLVLSPHFSSLWPICVASLAASIGVCVVAAVQADLPKEQQRPWSRPLVALLFFLQPIVRGWARYKWAWSERAQPHYPAHGATTPGDNKVAETTSYWSDGAIDRYTWLSRIIARVQAENWRTKTDTGYNDYDLELVGSNWARLRLTTVAEELAEGRRVFRCRLKSSWTFRGQAAFWLWFATAFGIVGILARVEPWLWMLLASVPVLQLFLNAERRRMQQLMTALLDRIASEQNLVKLDPPTEEELKRSKV